MTTWSGRLVDYLGEGLASARPTSLTLVTGGLGLYWSTDTTTLSTWDGSAWHNLSGTGSVTSVNMSVPADFAIAGNPITSSGTLALTETTQTANMVKAGPSSGSAAAPTYRSLVAADYQTATIPISAINATGTATSTTYLRGDGSWATPSVGSVNWGSIGGTLSSQTDLAAALAAAQLAGQSQLVGINDQTGTSYTLVLTDAGKDVRCNNASAVTLTVPLNSSVAFPVGTMIAFSQKGAGAVTATAASGVTINAANGAATTAQYDSRVLEKTDTDTWRVW